MANKIIQNREDLINDAESELWEMLEAVSDTYEDFVIGTLRGCRTVVNGVEKMITKIKANPEANSSTIIEYLAELRGIKKVNQGERQ